MQLYVYNTLTRQKELFVPIDPKQVKIYTCGPTVYSEPHVGNMRPYTFADLLRNTIKHVLGHQVLHTVNITDVGHLTDDGDHGEDKMEKGSKREGLSARDVAKKYEEHFKQYLTALNIDMFDNMPRATDYIKEQIEIVQTLETNGYTYTIPNDGIYMDTSKIADYGKLMGPNYKGHLEGLQSGARVEDAGKKNPTDFALRKFSPHDEKRQMERESPWGVGFPGRHIECSAMSRATLGDHFDIHTGGVDHISVHHTDEIAQSECSFTHGKKWVNYWMHNQFLNIGGKKVAKSSGDDLSLPGLQARGFDPLDLRYFFYGAHYRSFQDFTRENLEAAKNARHNLIKKIQTLTQDVQGIVDDSILTIAAKDLLDEIQNEYVGEMFDAIVKELLEDLSIHNAMAILQQNIGEMLKGTPNFDPRDLYVVLFWLEKNILKLGFFDQEPIIDIPKEIEELAKQRWESKQAKNYGLADELRKQLQDKGWDTKDAKDSYEIIKL